MRNILGEGFLKTPKEFPLLITSREGLPLHPEKAAQNIEWPV